MKNKLRSSKGNRPNKNLELNIETPKNKPDLGGGSNEEIQSQNTDDIIKIKYPNSVENANVVVKSEMSKSPTKRSKLLSSSKPRKEIKISLVEGMLYDDSGVSTNFNSLVNPKFIELNFRKRTCNDLQEGYSSINDSSHTYRCNNTFNVNDGETEQGLDKIAFGRQSEAQAQINDFQKSLKEMCASNLLGKELNKERRVKAQIQHLDSRRTRRTGFDRRK